MTVRVPLLFILTILTGAASAFAQGAYVSAVVFGDIVRSSHAEVPGVGDSGGGGEAVGFALRAGTPLGGAWGVEVEFAHPGEIDDEHELGLRFPVDTLPRGVPVISRDGDVGQLLPELIRAPLTYRVRTSERNTTLSAALWYEQPLTSRVSMAYLGGVAFTRSTYENEVTYSPLILGLPELALTLPPTLSESTIYGVQPMVGVESRIGMTDHLRLVPGLRLQASDGRWLIRPAVGLSWSF